MLHKFPYKKFGKLFLMTYLPGLRLLLGPWVSQAMHQHYEHDFIYFDFINYKANKRYIVPISNINETRFKTEYI